MKGIFLKHLFLTGEYEPRIRTTVEEEFGFWSRKYVVNIQFFYYKKNKKKKEEERRRKKKKKKKKKKEEERRKKKKK